MEKQTRAYIYAGLAVLLWSTVASAFKITLRYLDPIPLVFYSTLVSLLTLFLIFLFSGGIGKLATVSRKNVLRSAGLGFLNPFLYYIVLFKAYDILLGQEAITLNYTWPIMLALLSIPLLKQRIGWKSLLAIVISFLGVFVIATRGDILSFRFTNFPGAMLALGSAIIWAIYWIFNVKDDLDSVLRLFLNFLFGTIYILIYMLIFESFAFDDSRGLYGAIYVGLFEMGITFVLWLGALKLSSTTAKVANLIYAAPFLSLIVLHFIIGEDIYAPTLAGLILIIIGIILQRRFTDTS